MKTEAVVVCAGLSKRLRAKVRKPYLTLKGKPILAHTLEQLSNSNKIYKIIVVANRLDRSRCADLIRQYRIKKIKKIIAGGPKRQDSVHNGLKELDNDTGMVLIHDGIRPFIDENIIARSITCAGKFGACIVGVPVKATIKKVKSQNAKVKSVEMTLSRKTLWEIQTPQVFKKDLILKAYKKFGNTNVTDDAMLAEKLGKRVCVIMGSYKNIKITTPEDLVIAEAIARCA